MAPVGFRGSFTDGRWVDQRPKNDLLIEPSR